MAGQFSFGKTEVMYAMSSLCQMRIALLFLNRTSVMLPSHAQVSTVIQEASLYHILFAPDYGYAGRIHIWGSFYANGFMVPI